MKKSISMLLAASMVSTMLAGCGAAASSTPSAVSSSGEAAPSAAAAESVTLKLATWDNTSNNVVTDAVAAFEAANPNIKVEIIDIPSADYTTKLSVMLNGGSDDFRNTITDDGLRAIARDFKLDINESFLD